MAKFSAPAKEYGRYFPWQAVCTPDNLPIFAGRQIPETMENRITSLFGIRYPIVAGGMIWCSGWRLAAAVRRTGADRLRLDDARPAARAYPQMPRGDL